MPSVSGTGQAGAEIEVTPAMIDAGLEELYQHHYGEGLRHLLESVYRAMAYARVCASSTNAVR